ncbi:MAG: four helix bundle protein, partial [Caldilineales bacterium]|nr:four helix bundle protein [Caldilineales bacterium]
QDKRTLSLAEQLFEAVGSIVANISEGYSRGSGRDQARFHEYALGSARESRGWYWQGRQVLSEPVARHRISVVTRIVRLLLTMIPSECTHKLAEDGPTYDLHPFEPHAEIPFP